MTDAINSKDGSESGDLSANDAANNNNGANGVAVSDVSSDGAGDSGTAGVGDDFYSTPPEWLPEKFHVNTDEKFDSSASFQKAMESYAALETTLGAGKEKLKAELDADRSASLPQDSKGYEPPNFLERPVEGLPEGATINLPADDPMLVSAQKWAHKNQVSTEAFQDLVHNYVSSTVSYAPDYESEMKKLGDDAAGRVERLEKKIAANVPSEVYNSLVSTLKTDAGLVQALEHMTSHWDGAPPGHNSIGGNAGITELDIRAKMDTPEYRAGNEKVHLEVQQMYDTLYGTQAHDGAQRGRA